MLRLGSTICVWALVLSACAVRPVNPPIATVDADAGYRYTTRQARLPDRETLVILAFSGGGTRAAAFSFGVLEALRDTEVGGPRGAKGRMIDAVDIITGVSGGSFTALAYGLYGDGLFERYEQDFLKRDVEGALLARLFDPANWGDLWWATGWGRSELAADYYDEVLFHGATFATLQRGQGPLIVVTATDISTGARVPFQQPFFDVLCSDLSAVRLARAAASSSAVPVVLSPVTFNNYGGTCGYRVPAWIENLVEATPPRAIERARRQLADLTSFGDGAKRPYIHVVDGGVADNLALRGVLDVLEVFEAEHAAGRPTPLDHVRRIAIVVVNSLSQPATHWDASIAPPGSFAILLKATGVPIDHFSFEAIELLRDTQARWALLRRLRDSPAFDASRDPSLARAISTPAVDLYAIDVSFPALDDKAEVAYLNSLPTSFALPAEAVDRLRAAARRIVMASPEFQRLLRDTAPPI